MLLPWTPSLNFLAAISRTHHHVARQQLHGHHGSWADTYEPDNIIVMVPSPISHRPDGSPRMTVEEALAIAAASERSGGAAGDAVPPPRPTFAAVPVAAVVTTASGEADTHVPVAAAIVET